MKVPYLKKNHYFHLSCITKTHDLHLEMIETEGEIAEERKVVVDVCYCSRVVSLGVGTRSLTVT